MSASLFEPVHLGALALSNRIVMAPMTRSRAGAGDAPTAMNVEYYRQRASEGGLLLVYFGYTCSPAQTARATAVRPDSTARSRWLAGAS